MHRPVIRPEPSQNQADLLGQQKLADVPILNIEEFSVTNNRHPHTPARFIQ
jgi:hypothetical protein